MNNKYLLRNTRGFTLIELIVVIAILGILAALLIPQFSGFTGKSKLAVCIENRENVERHYKYLAVGDAPGLGETGAIGAENTTLSLDTVKNYFVTNSSDSFNFNELICPEGGVITGELKNDGTQTGELVLSCSLHANISSFSNLLFHSNFASLAQLKTLNSNGNLNWKIVDGKLVSNGSGENRAIFNDTNGTDYTINMNSVYTASSAGYGVYYRATDSSAISGYCFQFDPGLTPDQFVVRKVNNGSETSPIAAFSMSEMGADFKMNEPHDIEISVVGTSHIIKVDGKEVMAFSDSSYTEGNVGLRTWSNNTVEVNNVTIQKP